MDPAPFHEKELDPAAEAFIRIYKRERTLELWVRAEGSDRFELLNNYDICALAGELGPKRQQGDSQVPEGFYAIDFFNPESDYFLSLHVDYPNVRDRSMAQGDLNLGGDIYIHGGCNSDGCLAVTDEGIMELYWMAVEARSAGQQTIPVHIFPARLDDFSVGEPEAVGYLSSDECRACLEPCARRLGALARLSRWPPGHGARPESPKPWRNPARARNRWRKESAWLERDERARTAEGECRRKRSTT